uniref:GCN5-related N-acetyltransferase n=1 Tax=Cyanothece sp. (strain PCC 7425 / ATCC 29141) TaxID=395961 RepID=B8HNU0_CYAP4
MIKVNFKPATLSDRPLLVQLVQEYYEFDGHCFEPDIIHSLLTEILQQPACGSLWLIQLETLPIGYVFLSLSGYSLEYRGRDAFVDELYLRSDYRGQGIGRHTIEFLKQICAILGIKALHLEVERHNVHAQTFYRRVGFVDGDRYLMTQRIESGQ